MPRELEPDYRCAFSAGNVFLAGNQPDRRAGETGRTGMVQAKPGSSAANLERRVRHWRRAAHHRDGFTGKRLGKSSDRDSGKRRERSGSREGGGGFVSGTLIPFSPRESQGEIFYPIGR